MKKTAFVWTLGAAALSLSLAFAAPAQAAWPDKPIQIIVPYAAGGDTDFNARVYAKFLQPLLGQPLVVVNVAGAGGSIGGRRVKDAAPDGYTVLMWHEAMLVNSATGLIDFTFHDFEMVAMAAQEPGTMLCVRENAPWKTFKELMADSKAHPKKITFAGNLGGTTYLVAQLLNKAGADFNIVDHGGTAPRITALLGGHVDVIPNPVGSVISYIKKGEFRALATTRTTRHPALPQVPTVMELGYNVHFQYRYFFMFPKGTPKPIVDKMAAAVKKIATTNKAYAAEIEKAYLQQPYFLDAADAIKSLDAMDKVIRSVKLK